MARFRTVPVTATPKASPTQPFCRYCAGKIGRALGSVYFGEREESRSESGLFVHLKEKPETKEAAQKLVNQRIVSVRWNYDRKWIASVTVWDGETYKDEFFCKDECAVMLGIAAAMQGWGTTDYHTKVGT